MNYPKTKWMQLINLMIKNYDPLIVICGDKDAMSVIKHNNSKDILLIKILMTFKIHTDSCIIT